MAPLAPRVRTGAPASNATFAGNAQGTLYYSYVARRANFSAALAGCAAMNGSLVMWKDGASQNSVERYFYQAKVLGKYYWLGIRRPRAGAAFAYVDGSSAGQTVSNARPYAHWCVLLEPSTKERDAGRLACSCAACAPVACCRDWL